MKTKNPAIDVGFGVVDLADLSAARCSGEPNDGCGDLDHGPWTLPANQAVSLHPELEYQLVQIEGDRGASCLLLAANLVEQATQRYGLSEPVVLATVKGRALELLQLQR